MSLPHVWRQPLMKPAWLCQKLLMTWHDSMTCIAKLLPHTRLVIRSAKCTKYHNNSPNEEIGSQMVRPLCGEQGCFAECLWSPASTILWTYPSSLLSQPPPPL